MNKFLEVQPLMVRDKPILSQVVFEHSLELPQSNNIRVHHIQSSFFGRGAAWSEMRALVLNNHAEFQKTSKINF